MKKFIYILLSLLVLTSLGIAKNKVKTKVFGPYTVAADSTLSSSIDMDFDLEGYFNISAWCSHVIGTDDSAFSVQDTLDMYYYGEVSTGRALEWNDTTYTVHTDIADSISIYDNVTLLGKENTNLEFIAITPKVTNGLNIYSKYVSASSDDSLVFFIIVTYH
jgi:hypothetical protein